MPGDVEYPLAQFQHTLANEAEIRRLVRHMNAAFEKPLPERVLDESFNTFWPQLETKLKELLKKEAAETEKGSGNPVSSACTRARGHPSGVPQKDP